MAQRRADQANHVVDPILGRPKHDRLPMALDGGVGPAHPLGETECLLGQVVGRCPLTQREMTSRPEPQGSYFQGRLTAGCDRSLEAVELVPGVAKPTEIEERDEPEVAALGDQTGLVGGDRDGEDLVGDGQPFTRQLRAPPVVEECPEGLGELLRATETTGHGHCLITGSEDIAVGDVPVSAPHQP